LRMPETMFLRMPAMEKARFQAWINSLKDEEEKEVKKIVVDTIQGITKRAKQFAVVDNGYLRSSIHGQLDPDGFGGRVYTGGDYGPYVEFGTGDKVVAPEDVKDYAMTFKGKGIRKVNLSARPYLFPAVRMGLKLMEQKLARLGFKLKK
jgi:hypothetical protein